jgi:ABC-type multidrug transport system fused ATPase/permease subunit
MSLVPSPQSVVKSTPSALSRYHQDKRKSKRKASLRRLLDIARPDFGTISVGVLALIVNSLTNLSFPWLIGSALDNASAEQLQDFVLRSAGVFAAGSLASWVRVYCLGTATENIANRLRALLFESLLGQDMEFYEKTQLGECSFINCCRNCLIYSLSQRIHLTYLFTRRSFR